MRQTVVGVFDQRSAAQRAAEVLAQHGIDRDRVQVTGADEEESIGGGADEHRGEGMGGRIRSFFAEVFGSDESSHQHASEYREAVRRGGAVVRVDVEEEREVLEARQALQEAGAVDIDERVKEWRAEGWDYEGTASGGAMGATSAASTDRTAGERQVVPVVQEELEVGKREVSTGGIRVYTRTVERPVEENLQLRSEHATIERNRVDRPATEADLAGMQDRTIEVRETAERPVVSKTAHVVEEVVVGKETQIENQTIRETVRGTEVQVEQLRAEAQRGGYDTGYRQHFQQNYGSSGGTYDEYEPAYLYGQSLAGDERYRGRSWNDVETDARAGWEARSGGRSGGGAWERVKGAVRHSWERMTHH